MSTLTTVFQHSFGSHSYGIQRSKRNKIVQIGKEVKLLLFPDGMNLYTENSKDTVRKLLELITELSKIGDTKSVHRNHLHSYILIMKNLRN